MKIVGTNELKRYEQALASWDKAIALEPDYAEAYYNRGVALQALRRFDEALASWDKAIALAPDFAEAYNNRGITLNELKRYEEALASWDKAIALIPELAEAYYNRGNVLQRLKRFGEALASYDKTIALKPDFADAHNNRAASLKELKRFEEALASCDKAIALKPDLAEAYNNRGAALQKLKRFEEALASCDKALELMPGTAEAYNNRGTTLNELKRYEEALASCDNAIALKPDYAEAYHNRGNALIELKRYEEAIASYDKALALEPDAETYNNRANALKALKRYEEAISNYDKAIALKPDYEFVLEDLIFTKMIICDWNNLETQVAQLVHKIEFAEKVSSPSQPFPILAISDSPKLQRKTAEIYILAKHPLSKALPEIPKRPRRDKIHIGYFSADFREHAIAFLTAELLEKHNRSQFEVTAFSFGPNTRDGMRGRLEAAFDKFIDVRNQSDKDVASLARKLEIDIAVDLGGVTQDSRTDIFAIRAAPIQVNYLGYPGTMGADYIDYIVADRFVIPDMQQQHYSEKVIYMPDTFQANDSNRLISDRTPSRANVGLPENAFVFCSFNNSYKITATFFDIWARLLREIDGSVLWLLGDNADVKRNLQNEIERRGVDSTRLIFASRVPYSEYLARYRLADLFLDTSPFNGGTTASDALWVGLPLITCSGEAFAARMAGSLLRAIGMPELITESTTDYEALALKLARDPDLMTSIKTRLARNRSSHPLFNAQRFTHHIEVAYTAMYERYQAGLSLDHIHVPQSDR